MTAVLALRDWPLVVPTLMDEVPHYRVSDVVELIEERLGPLEPDELNLIMAIVLRIRCKRSEFEPGLPVSGDAGV
jgi:hypothetical protein